jgi:hypothetical protein
LILFAPGRRYSREEMRLNVRKAVSRKAVIHISPNGTLVDARVEAVRCCQIAHWAAAHSTNSLAA